MKNPRKHKATFGPCQGFTLLEVVLALAIVAVAVAAIVRLHLISVRAAGQAQARQWATVVANNQIESARGAESLKNGTTSGTARKGLMDFQWTMQVQEKKSVGDFKNLVGLRHIQVDSRWLDGPHQQSVRLNAYVKQ